MSSTASSTNASAILPLGSGVAEENHASTLEQLLRQAPSSARVILRALIAAQAQHALFNRSKPVIVAVSGGADSICLLHALHQLAPIWCLSLHVAHLDHALRPASAADATFVADFAQQLALPFHTARLTPGILDDDPRGLEAAARSARYAFLRQVASQLGDDVTIATAHHQDDQAETILLHLVQGSGLAGLAGMAWVGQLPDAHQPSIRLVRPLLGTPRVAIHDYLLDYGLTWREDLTNQDPSYLRNRLRHEVLPSLAAINPNIHATLARTADLLAAEAAHAARRDHAALDKVTTTHTAATRWVIDLNRLAEYDLATRRGTVRQAMILLGIDLRAVGLDGIDALLSQCTPSGPHPLIAGWAWTILRGDHGAMLSLHRTGILPLAVDHPHLGAPLTPPLPLPLVGTVSHAGWQLESTLLAPSNLPDDWRSRAHPWRLFCDADRSGDLYLTTPQAGMQIAPLGMGGHRRAVGDIFTDHKVPPYLRPGWPIVIQRGSMQGHSLDDHRVVWLCGLAMADAVRIDPATRQVRQLVWQAAPDARVNPVNPEASP